ncbi:MAG: transposase [Planctomycetes bacterium]|nr:transposase [Planctomycetota bacterium]MCH8211341.1 transposase [Planctomycetota bacterium]
MNAYAECFVRSIKHKCTNLLLLFSERSLRRVISEYIESYNGERFHQGVRNQPNGRHCG